jgi:glycine/D-amino acid oxidase-like deaminating enzyme
VPPEETTRPVEDACYWLARRPLRDGHRLSGPAEADVVIVGGGFTGLWTALRLKDLAPTLEVALLEKETVAYGASGRNAGMLAEVLDHSHGLAIAHFGREEARLLAALGRENKAMMLRSLDEAGIDCDLEATGTLHVALLPSQLAELEASRASARELGLEHLRLLDRDEVRGEIHSPRYEGGLFDPSGAILDPVKLTEGLLREAERRGVKVYERTGVSALEGRGATVVARTPHGDVIGRRAVLATNAYAHHLLPGLRFRFIPLYDYILVSEPLSEDRLQRIGWRGRQGVTDVRSFFKYYRLTRDDRVLFGTSEALYHGGNRVDRACDHSAVHYAELRKSFFRHFPDIAGLEFPYAWGGPICATTRFTPFFGFALGGRVAYGLGYTGHGLGSTHLAGRILAHMVLDRPSALLDLRLVRRKPFPYPPEPFRSWAVGVVSRDLRRVDAGQPPSLLLRALDALGIGLSS